MNCRLSVPAVRGVVSSVNVSPSTVYVMMRKPVWVIVNEVPLSD